MPASKGTEAVCAFANDLANHNRPGALFVGVQDNGTPWGLSIGGQPLEQLTGIKTDGRILPPPTLLAEKRKLKGVDVAVVTVWPADSPPVRYDSRICVRVTGQPLPNPGLIHWLPLHGHGVGYMTGNSLQVAPLALL